MRPCEGGLRSLWKLWHIEPNMSPGNLPLYLAHLKSMNRTPPSSPKNNFSFRFPMEFWHLMWSIFVGGPWKMSSAPYWWTSTGFKLSWLVKVFRCNFWMMFFNSKSPKRTSLWSNSRHICRFWMGKLTRKLREDLKKKYPAFSTTIKYKNKAGKTRFHGSKQLRSTQNLASQIGSNLPWLLYSIFATSPKAFSGTVNDQSIF